MTAPGERRLRGAAGAGVCVAREGALGHLTLDRPRAINALTTPMVDTLDAALRAWEDDPEVRVVLLDGAGERGFCAGGDVVALRQSALSDGAAARAFWRAEYHLNARIARYPKPIVAIMDGIVMGGGIGLAGHASHRVATERLDAAMPEVSIGFAPDVGGTWLLSRAPGELGTHLALTGARVGARDALTVGLADVVVPSAALAALTEDLCEGDVYAALGRRVASLSSTRLVPRGTLAQAWPWIAAAYAHDDATEILAALRARPEAEARRAGETLARQPPAAVAVALRALRAAARLPTLEECLAHGLRISCDFLSTPGFAEGIRAVADARAGRGAG
ncbi:enoyl-CoA hydratase/isomerase family protein [Conexibacter sp. CPCC 206217]|uniref:enoyl-CoA hydratase/isomerase family protein n=1 Tax=Conexibacter sp. CPCC 206217 TaxID=3064574 RepID=UPI00271D2FC9|nr:enoyl-CoA hydratase/isomerase family protein [Conexibacter sp. CPCC 206217]MDO8209618.1 enoyl-CoA hydratase/isomerase family protein [Conexibacter sp. CPCC 206217]